MPHATNTDDPDYTVGITANKTKWRQSELLYCGFMLNMKTLLRQDRQHDKPGPNWNVSLIMIIQYLTAHQHLQYCDYQNQLLA